jgi:hypothetical protein
MRMPERIPISLMASERSRKLSLLHGSLARLLRHFDQALSGNGGTLGGGGHKA